MDEQKLSGFYRTWRENIAGLSDAYIYDANKKLLPTRDIFSMYRKIVERFLTGEIEEFEKIIIMPGIRGAGKTTLLMQILNIEKFIGPKDGKLIANLSKLSEKFFLDVSKLKLENISLNDFFKFYENTKGFTFENLKEKFIILLDEVHYDEQWGLFLKSIFDRTKGHKNILMVATGSSAIHLKMNPDLSRRVRIEEIFPMKFNEYLILRYGKYPISGLSNDLQKIIFNSSNAAEVYNELNNKTDQINRFFTELHPQAEADFFEIGNFPFTINISNKIKALEQLKNVINSIIVKDIVGFEKFNTQTVAKINTLLYLIANSDIISYDNLRTTLKIERFETLIALIDVLIMSGVLVKINSLGKPFASTRKTPKLLFTAPSLRTAVLDNVFASSVEGKKLEDYFALVFLKDLKNKKARNIAFDIAEGGADFILDLVDKEKIIVEVGFNKETTEQIKNTSKKVKAKYGILIGGKKLELQDDLIVKIPLNYWLLV